MRSSSEWGSPRKMCLLTVGDQVLDHSDLTNRDETGFAVIPVAAEVRELKVEGRLEFAILFSQQVSEVLEEELDHAGGLHVVDVHCCRELLSLYHPVKDALIFGVLDVPFREEGALDLLEPEAGGLQKSVQRAVEFHEE